MERLTEKGRLALDFIISATMEAYTSISKADIARGAGLNVRGISSVLNKLVRDGYIYETADNKYVLATMARQEKIEAIQETKEEIIEVAGGTLRLVEKEDCEEQVFVEFEAEGQYIRIYRINKEDLNEVLYYIEALADLDVSYMFLRGDLAELEELYETTINTLADEIEPYVLKATKKAPGEECHYKRKRRVLTQRRTLTYIISYIADFVKTFWKKGKKKYYPRAKRVVFEGGHFSDNGYNQKTSFGAILILKVKGTILSGFDTS